MGIVWEAYHKQVPLLGVPENPIDWIVLPIQIIPTSNRGRAILRKSKKQANLVHFLKEISLQTDSACCV